MITFYEITKQFSVEVTVNASSEFGSAFMLQNKVMEVRVNKNALY